MNGATILPNPQRIHQRLFRNDNGTFAGLMLFIRPAVSDLTNWDWQLDSCYLYQYIYPDRYDKLSPELKSQYTVGAQQVISEMHSIIDPQITFISKLLDYLNNQDLMAKAGKVYVAAFKRAWQTLANDPGWDPTADPQKYAQKMYGVSPDMYQGEIGFSTLVNELKNLIAALQACFNKQEDLLQKLDAELSKSHTKPPQPAGQYPQPYTHVKVVPSQPLKPRPPEDPNWSSIYNQYVQESAAEFKALDRRVKFDRARILRFIRKPASSRLLTNEEAMKTISDSVASNKVHFSTQVKPPAGFRTPIIALPGVAVSAVKAPIGFTDWKLVESLASEFRSVCADLYYLQGRYNFTMPIIEDAIVKVESPPPNNPGDMTNF